MMKVTSIAVFDDSRHMIVGPVLDAGEANEQKLLKYTLIQLIDAIKDKEGITNFDPTVTEYNASPSPAEKPYVIPYVLHKVTMSTQFDDGMPGPSAYIWFCYINDKQIAHGPSYILAVFNADRYPHPPLVFLANNLTVKNKLVRYQQRFLGLIASSYKDHKYLKYYERSDINDYALMVYDPREKRTCESIKGRIYSVQLQ